MNREDLGPILVRLYETSRQQLDLTLELMCSLTAAMEVLQANDPGFSTAYRARLDALHCGEMGKTITQKLAAFDKIVERLKGDCN
jgi:hypothetical protein